jgi:hypothetical protein
METIGCVGLSTSSAVQGHFTLTASASPTVIRGGVPNLTGTLDKAIDPPSGGGVTLWGAYSHKTLDFKRVRCGVPEKFIEVVDP